MEFRRLSPRYPKWEVKTRLYTGLICVIIAQVKWINAGAGGDHLGVVDDE